MSPIVTSCCTGRGLVVARVCAAAGAVTANARTRDQSRPNLISFTENLQPSSCKRSSAHGWYLDVLAGQPDFRLVQRLLRATATRRPPHDAPSGALPYRHGMRRSIQL